jgi:hypothetical protein
VAEELAWLELEHGHVALETIQVFRLVPVPNEKMQPHLDRARARLGIEDEAEAEEE